MAVLEPVGPELAPTRAPFKLLGVTFAPLSLPMERRMQTFAVFAYMFVFIFSGLTLSIVSVYLVFYTEDWKWLPFTYFLWYFYDLDTGERGGREYT